METRFVIGRAALPRITAGHPWLYREALRPAARSAIPETGDAVVLEGSEGQRVGSGIFDATSPLAVRVWTRGDTRLDANLFRTRLAHAIALRTRTFDIADTNAYRILHGEGDRMPGLVIDRYGSIAVVRTDGDAAAVLLTRHTAEIETQLRALGIDTLLHRAVGSNRSGKGLEASSPPTPAGPVLRFGAEVQGPVHVHEHGMPFVADLLRGQKTGSFLDQRDNRRRVRQLAQGRRVLNLFSYAGGFSQAAVLGGATHVTSVDIAHDAHRTAQASFRLAGLDPSQHSFVTADAFQWLEDASNAKKRFDLIISDPPSFAPNEKSLPKALTAYKRLHRACVRLLADDGLFCAASCSSHVDAKTFLSTLDEATLEERPLRVLEQHGAPLDHPVLPAFPEGAYLKFVLLG